MMSQIYDMMRPSTFRVLAPACALALSACAISTRQEVDLGEVYSAQINRQLPMVRDPEVERYINLVGDSIASLVDDRNLNWRFSVVDQRDVNAFAVPGGFVYIYRGLVERTTNMSQLAGVIAHEIGHVTQRHAVTQMRDAQRANAGVTLLCVLTRVCDYGVTEVAVQAGGSALFARFSRDDEREADAVAIEYLLRARIDPSGIPEMFQILLNERQTRPGGLDSWFRTHPLEEDRLADTRAAIAALPRERLVGLTKDSPRYQAFRQRLSALPVAAAGR